MSGDKFENLCSIVGSVSRETFEDLVRFEQIFLKWNQRINLVAHSTVSDLWSRHILDSAQLARIEPDAKIWLDVGSGGGFPGLVMAILLRERDGEIRLVESNRKKAGFLQTMVGEFNLPAHVHACRIDDAYKLIPAPQVVTARALAPLPSLIELVEPWLMTGAHGLFHKGRDYRPEVQESTHRWDFDLVEHGSAIDGEGVVLELRDLRTR